MEKAFPPVNDLIDYIQNDWDYIQTGQKLANVIVTVLAIVIGVCSYAWTAIQLWWADNGDDVMKFLRTSQQNLKLYTNQLVDFVFFRVLIKN